MSGKITAGKTRPGRSGQGTGGGMTTGALLAGAVTLLALPSAVLAISTRFAPPVPRQAVAPLDESAGLAAAFPLRSLAHGAQFPFTPAGTPNRPVRSVTVAVRVDAETAQAISVRAPRIAKSDETGAGAVHISQTAFNLGVSRGYRNFSQGLVSGTDRGKAAAPDLSLLPGGTAIGAAPSRFSPRIVIEEKLPPGRAPRTFAGGEDKVDLGGSYRLTRNIDVTAGVRYSQERERLRPLTDGNPDNQAVYVGTQFRF